MPSFQLELIGASFRLRLERGSIGTGGYGVVRRALTRA